MEDEGNNNIFEVSMSSFSTGDQVSRTLKEALDTLEKGGFLPENQLLDYKEEAGRRGKDGVLQAGNSHNENAAKSLAGAVACMSNSDDGGVLLLGVSDKGELLGTDLDKGFLRSRLYELLNRSVTTIITEHFVNGIRLLAIRVPESFQPVLHNKRLTWRVGANCVDVDPLTWQTHKQQRAGHDWSALPSGVPAKEANPTSLAIARRFLHESGDPRALDLAVETDLGLLRRLNAVDSSGILTNGGKALFVGLGRPALDYMRRPYFGGDTETRVNEPNQSLLEELLEVFATARAYNPEQHIERGLQIARYRALPEIALREVIVNGVAHRDWQQIEPTTVEHIGNTLRVTSPGGFFGGVTPANIINHPPRSRNTSLNEALAKLRIAERQGIGVDRVYAEMLRLGYPAPEFSEPYPNAVLVVLTGDRPDLSWINWLTKIGAHASSDLRLLMSLNQLVTQGWTDAEDLKTLLQVSPAEAQQEIRKLLGLNISGEAVTQIVEGTPSGSPTAIALTSVARHELDEESAGPSRFTAPTYEGVASSYAKHRGRISTTELASIVHDYPTNLGTVLKSLEDTGLLKPSRENRRGAGFHYVFCAPEEEKL